MDTYLTEARVYGKALISPIVENQKKFIIIARARSGTTLLVDMLNSHPEMDCEYEILSSGKVFPIQTICAHARKSQGLAYGAKILSYQMVQVHRIKDPVNFMHKLAARGFRFIHLERNTIHQCFSLAVAQASKRYHRISSDTLETTVKLNPQEMVRRVRWNLKLLDYERRSLSYVDHLSLKYEDDLNASECHQAAADKVFEYLGISSHPISVRLQKMITKSLNQTVTNYTEVIDAIYI